MDSVFRPVISRDEDEDSLMSPVDSRDQRSRGPPSSSGRLEYTERRSSISVTSVEASIDPASLRLEPTARVPGSRRPFVSTAPSEQRLPGNGPVRSGTLDLRSIPRAEKDENAHPFDSFVYETGLKAAGYLEPLDVSRKKIKSRFLHGLEKEKFKKNLEAFLEQKAVKKRGEMMVRFVGTQDVHSPFVHLYTTSLPEDLSPIRIQPDDVETQSNEPFTLWTHLREIKGASHWSCKAKGFWPLRVVLAGPDDGKAPSKTPNPSPFTDPSFSLAGLSLPPPPSADEIPDPPATATDALRNVDAATKANTVANSTTVPPPPEPTILGSVKQLGEALTKSLPEGIEKLPQTLRERFGALTSSWSQQQQGGEERYDRGMELREEDERAAKEARKLARRAARALRAEEEERQMRLEDAEARREARRDRRAQRERR